MIRIILLGFSLGIAGYLCIGEKQDQKADEQFLNDFMQELREEQGRSKID